jgi:hypothetical protein
MFVDTRTPSRKYRTRLFQRSLRGLNCWLRFEHGVIGSHG